MTFCVDGNKLMITKMLVMILKFKTLIMSSIKSPNIVKLSIIETYILAAKRLLFTFNFPFKNARIKVL